MMLHGSIRLTKRLRKHAVWNREPKCYGAAWCDLLLLANDEDRSVTIHGEVIPLKRGQLAWSLTRLAEEWNRSEEWIKRFLKFCQDESMLLVDISRRRTILTVLNYDAYNIEPGTDSVSEPGTDSVSEPEQKGEGGRGMGKKGIKEGSTNQFRGSAWKPQKNAAASPAQALFLLDQELAEVRAEISECDDLAKPVPPALRQRRRDLEKKRAVLADGHHGGAA